MQTGIFLEGTISSIFFECAIDKEVDVSKLKKELIKVLESNSDQLHLVMAFGKGAERKTGITLPTGLKDFEALSGVNNLTMPATQGDLFVWGHSHSKSEIVDLSMNFKKRFEPFGEILLEQEGFRYHDSRDLTGFVDGSANPKGALRYPEALIAEGDDFEQGSFVLVQKWDHDLKAFHELHTEDQERVIGRTKEDSIELEGDAMPDNSHVSSVDLKIDGEAMKIYRRSFPFSDNRTKGLYFLGFAKDIKRFDVQLRSMLGLKEDKVYDRLMDFSVPVTGAYYFAPSASKLIELLTP